nr:unnamed protein product [Digitaria exilis]
MHVIAVPSVPKKTGEFSTADEVINSLLDVRPENWGLPPFNDWIEGTLPIEPWFISGPVIKGFGRGSKEPWLLHDFAEDFYGEELRLAIVGYIRHEASGPLGRRRVCRAFEVLVQSCLPLFSSRRICLSSLGPRDSPEAALELAPTSSS